MRPCIIAVIALLSISYTETQAIQLNQKALFVDDIVKALAEADKKEEEDKKNHQTQTKKDAPANATAAAQPINATSLAAP